MVDWQDATERFVTSLGLCIATGIYIFMFVLTATYVNASHKRKTKIRRRYPSAKGHRKARSSKQSPFKTTQQLRFAVDVWLENEELAVSKYGLIQNWNVTLIEDMSYVFADAVGFDADLSQWDTSNVKNFTAMFRGAKGFRGDSIRSWSTENCEDFSHMFEDSTFSGDLTLWNVQNGKNFDKMFHKATFFDLDLAPPLMSPNPVSRLDLDFYASYQEDDAWQPEIDNDFTDDGPSAFEIARESLFRPTSAMYVGFFSYSIVALATLVVFCSRGR